MEFIKSYPPEVRECQARLGAGLRMIDAQEYGMLLAADSESERSRIRLAAERTRAPFIKMLVDLEIHSLITLVMSADEARRLDLT